jgi:hypothetical protein
LIVPAISLDKDLWACFLAIVLTCSKVRFPVCLKMAPLVFLLCLTGSFKSLIINDEVHGKSSTALISLDWIANLIYSLILV